jgi:hypothetical protein
MKITVQGKEIEYNVISISAKCSDLCHTQLCNNDIVVAEHDGYVPKLMPGDHGGDYVMLDIDLETGTILNWKRPTRKTVEATKWTLDGDAALADDGPIDIDDPIHIPKIK